MPPGLLFVSRRPLTRDLQHAGRSIVSTHLGFNISLGCECFSCHSHAHKAGHTRPFLHVDNKHRSSIPTTTIKRTAANTASTPNTTMDFNGSSPFPEGVISFLDTDLYKLTMQCAVLKYFKDIPVTYAFKNRTPEKKLSRAAFRWLQIQINSIPPTPLSLLTVSLTICRAWQYCVVK